MKKLWILCLSLWMMCGMCICFAAEETLAASGTCGENVTWKIFSSSYEDEFGDVSYEKTLIISGEGAMLDYSETEQPEWVTLEDGLSEYMKEIVVEDGVTHIGSHAFMGMTAETIHIGANVESIGKDAFCEITGANQVIVSEENVAYKDVAGVLFDKAGETLLYYPSDRMLPTYMVPKDVKRIGTKAFMGATMLKKIRLPLSLQSIEADAFSGCKKLAHVRITGGSEALWAQVTVADGNDVLSAATRTYAPIIQASGSFGEALTWTFDDFGVLTISGMGAMPEFTSYTNAPWYAHRGSVVALVIEDGVTSVSSSAFYNYYFMYTAELGDGVTDIGYRAFGACNTLYEITLGDSIKTIGKKAFENCYKLAHAKLPNSLKTIEAQAFAGCSALFSVHIPDSTTSMGEYAFHECRKLRTAEIGSGVTVIEDDTFNGCSRLESIVLKGDITSIGMNAFAYCASLKSIVLPESLQTIGRGAFSFCSNLQEVAIPSGVTVLNIQTFYYCIGLKKVTMANTVTKIDASAFYRCTNLQEIVLPESLVYIGRAAFELCESLQTVTIPQNVGIIEIGAFASCFQLKEITVAEENAKYASVDGALYDKETTTLLCCPAGIEKSMFTIPASVVTIAENACKGCKNVESILIPEGVSAIGFAAFHSATSLKSIIIPDSVTDMGTSVFANCTALESVKLPQNLTQIGFSMFAGCTALQTYTIPEGIETIEDSAFEACENLTSVTIPKSVTTIAYYAFLDCAALSAVYYGGSSADWAMVDIEPYNDELKAATIHYAIESGTCGDNLFWELTEDGVLTISGTGMMTDWKDGSDAPWSDKKRQVKKVCFEEGVQSIGTHAFDNFFLLEEIEIGKSVIVIYDQAFYNCDLLTTVYIPENVLLMGDAFFGCDGLENIEVAEGNTKYSSLDGVLYDKQQIYLVRCPEGKKGEFKIPDSVFVIEDIAFYDCDYITNIVFGSNVGVICGDAFYGCDGLTEIQLNGIVDIESGAFAYCRNLTRVVIGDSVESLGTYVFGECYSLTDVVIGKSLKNISEGTFAGCSALEKIVIPDTVEKISIYAFETCFALHSITIGKSVSVIEEHAFTASKGLKDIYYNGSPSEWKKIDIQTSNEELHAATIHYAKTFSVTETVQENEAVTVTVLLEEKPEEGIVMLASYDKDGRFIGFDKQSMPEGNTATLSVTAAEGGTYKTMLWQAVGALKPLSAAE